MRHANNLLAWLRDASVALLCPPPAAACSYQYVTYVAANDMYDGLKTAAELFVNYTISRFEQVKQLHIILLVVTLVLVLLFVWKMFRPYVQKLHAESKTMAGMMSQLPAEVDIEGHVKTHVLGLRRDDANRGSSLRMGSMDAGAASTAVPGMDAAGRRSMPGMPLLPAPPVAGAGRGWGGGRGSAPGALQGNEYDGARSPQPGGQWDDDE